MNLERISKEAIITQLQYYPGMSGGTEENRQ
jgi:hypothetical protein